jgi:hypothetical protein
MNGGIINSVTRSNLVGYFYRIVRKRVETSTVIIKCGFCAKIVILESRSACVILMCCNSQESPKVGIDKHLNVSELKSNWITKNVH